MATRPAEELLYDSEATLRLVDDALDDIRDLESEHAEMERKLNRIGQGLRPVAADAGQRQALVTAGNN